MRIKISIISSLIFLLSTQAFSQDSFVKNNTDNAFASYPAYLKQKETKQTFWEKMGMLFGVQAGYSYSYWENNITFDPLLFTDLNYTFTSHLLDVNIATPIIGYKNKWAIDNFSNSEGKVENKFTEINMWGLAKLTNYLTNKNSKDYMGLNYLVIFGPIYQKHEVKSPTYNLEKTQVGLLFNLLTYSQQSEQFYDKDLKLIDENGYYFDINSNLKVDRTTIGLSTLEFFRTLVDWYSFTIAHNLVSAKKMKYFTTLIPFPSVNWFYDKSKYVYGAPNDLQTLNLEGSNYELGVAWSPSLYIPRKDPKIILMSNLSYFPWGGTTHHLKVGDNFETDILRKTDALSCKVSILINL